MRVVVVGAGIVGMSTTLALRSAGSWPLRSGPCLMTLAPVLGETLAAAALDGSTPADRG